MDRGGWTRENLSGVIERDRRGEGSDDRFPLNRFSRTRNKNFPHFKYLTFVDTLLNFLRTFLHALLALSWKYCACISLFIIPVIYGDISQWIDIIQLPALFLNNLRSPIVIMKHAMSQSF